MAEVVTTETLEGRKRRGLLYRIACIIGIAVIVIAVFWALGKLDMAIKTVLITSFFVFILHRLVDFCQKKGVPRGIGVLIGYVICFGIAALILAVIGPMIWEQVAGFIAMLPTYIDMIEEWALGLWNSYGYLLTNETVNNVLTNLGQTISSKVGGFAMNLANSVFSGVASTVSLLITLILSCVAAWWLLVDYHKIGTEAKIIVGPKYLDDFMSVFHICGDSFGGYIKGVAIASIFTGIIAFIGFTLIGLPYPLVLALVTALMNFVPVLGPWVGGIIAALIGITVSPMTAVLSIIVTIAAQQITDNFISPRIMSSTTSMHPALVIIALAVGSSIGGVLGMLFAVPVAAIIKGVFAFYFEKRTGRSLITEDGAFFPAKTARKSRSKKGKPETDEAGEAPGDKVAVTEVATATDVVSSADDPVSPESADASDAFDRK